MTTRKKFDRNRIIAEYRANLRDAKIAVILGAIIMIIIFATGPHA